MAQQTALKRLRTVQNRQWRAGKGQSPLDKPIQEGVADLRGLLSANFEVQHNLAPVERDAHPHDSAEIFRKDNTVKHQAEELFTTQIPLPELFDPRPAFHHPGPGNCAAARCRFGTQMLQVARTDACSRCPEDTIAQLGAEETESRFVTYSTTANTMKEDFVKPTADPLSLDALVKTYDIDNAYEQYKRLEFIEKLGRHVGLDVASVLELGSATGQMTLLLSAIARHVVAVDGSSEFIRIARARLGDAANVQFHQSMFESLTLDRTFDVVIMHHVLEHVQHVPPILACLQPLMHTDSILAVTVPNAYALSRQLAVKMRLLSEVYELTENDRHHGHVRVYDWSTLEDQLTRGGFSIVGKHGLSFKLLSDKQNIALLEACIIGEDQIKGLWQLGDDHPEIAGAIMLVARRSST